MDTRQNNHHTSYLGIKILEPALDSSQLCTVLTHLSLNVDGCGDGSAKETRYSMQTEAGRATTVYNTLKCSCTFRKWGYVALHHPNILQHFIISLEPIPRSHCTGHDTNVHTYSCIQYILSALNVQMCKKRQEFRSQVECAVMANGLFILLTCHDGHGCNKL